MASIYGYEALQTQEGSNSYCISYTIQKDGRAIGTFKDFLTDYAAIEISHPRDQELFYTNVQQYYTAFPATLHDEEAFIRELIDLERVELVFRENTEKGYPITVKLSARKRLEAHEDWINRVGDKQVIPRDKIYRAFSERHVRNILRLEEFAEYTVYRSLGDFVIKL